MSFKPTVAGPRGGVNTQLIEMTYQAPTPFPAFDTPGQKRAETYIGKRLHICAQEAVTCPIRAMYFKLYDGEDWHQDAITLSDRDLDYPEHLRPPPGFDRAEYDFVREQLKTEFSAVNRVRSYFEALRQPFDEAAQAGRINVKTIGDKIYKAVKPPPDSNANARGLELAAKIASVAGALPPPFGNVGKGVSSTLALGAYFSRSDGSSQLSDDVKVKAGELADLMQTRLFAAQASIRGLALLFLSDYGKLTGMADKLSTDDWRLDNSQSLLNLTLATRRWYAEQITPVAYPWLLRGTPPSYGPTTANGLQCRIPGWIDAYRNPWSEQPANAQTRATESWETKGSPIQPTFFFGRDRTYNASPSSEVADLLFNPVQVDDLNGGPLGLDKLTFLSPRVFGKLLRANHRADLCDLPHG
jgi:hypothetical protein